jgi:hypothetical protein
MTQNRDRFATLLNVASALVSDTALHPVQTDPFRISHEFFLETPKRGVMTELPGSPLPSESFGPNNNYPENATPTVRKQKEVIPLLDFTTRASPFLHKKITL